MRVLLIIIQGIFLNQGVLGLLGKSHDIDTQEMTKFHEARKPLGRETQPCEAMGRLIRLDVKDSGCTTE